MWLCGQVTVCPECTVLPPRWMVSTGQLQNENEFGQLRHRGHPQLWVVIRWPCAVCRGKLIWQHKTWGHTHMWECRQPWGHRMVCVGVRRTGKQQQQWQFAHQLSNQHLLFPPFGIDNADLGIWAVKSDALEQPVCGHDPSASVKLFNL